MSGLSPAQSVNPHVDTTSHNRMLSAGRLSTLWIVLCRMRVRKAVTSRIMGACSRAAKLKNVSALVQLS